MIDAKRLTEIEKRCKDAVFGYTTVTTQIYFRDVTDLLTELNVATARSVSLELEVERLTKVIEAL